METQTTSAPHIKNGREQFNSSAIPEYKPVQGNIIISCIPTWDEAISWLKSFRSGPEARFNEYNISGVAGDYKIIGYKTEATND